MLLALASGSASLSLIDIFTSLGHHLGEGQEWSDDRQGKDVILWSIRFPRVMLAGLSGAGLSLVGATIQALVRNPMADPWLLGVSSGASLGAVLVIVSGLSLFGLASIHLMAFLGALAAASVIYFISRQGAHFSSTRLIFTGLAISFSLEALTQILIFTANHQAQMQNVMFWTMGSLGGAENKDLPLPAVSVMLGFILLFRCRNQLNVACLNEVKAFSLGLDFNALRRHLFLLCAALTSVIVSMTGSIGFVGLMVPHVLRLILGNDYRLLIPGCLLGGAGFMIIADALARHLFSPHEIPIGVITALLGSPIFIVLMRGSHD